MARPEVGGAGVTGIRATPRGRPGFSHGGGEGSTRLLSPPARARERASERLHARAGPLGARSSRSPAAACCGSRRRDTGWACPGGRGALAGAGPTQRQGAGPGLALAPLASLWARSPRSPRSLAAPAPLAPEPGPTCPQIRGAGGSQPARPSPPPSPSRQQQPGQRKLRFSGARSRPEGGCRGSAPWALWIPRAEAKAAASQSQYCSLVSRMDGHHSKNMN